MLLPGRFMGRQMRDLFLCGGPSLVLAKRHIQSACAPLVVHILPPLMTSSSPFRTAFVFMPGTQQHSFFFGLQLQKILFEFRNRFLKAELAGACVTSNLTLQPGDNFI